MIERLRGAIDDPSVAAIARGARCAFALVGDHWRLVVVVDDDGARVADDAAPDCTLVADDQTWHDLTADEPPAGRHGLVHLVRTGAVTCEGSALAFERSVQIVRTILDASRATVQHAPMGGPLRARGSYARITTSLGTADVHVERAGAGTQLLAFATAGSDTTQWHGMLTHTDLADRYELVTADLPWHGRSSPAWGVPPGAYRLDPDAYTEWIVAVADALALERPVLVGVSMGGAAVVHAIATRPDRFAGAVACQAGPSVQARAHPHLRGTIASPALFVPEWTHGLMNPASPIEHRRRVWWGYSSGGHGLYAADIDSYLQWDLDEVAHLLTDRSPHIAVLSGAFDTSVPPARSRALAGRIPNASFAEMPELGHFPHAEHPEAFAPHLEAAIGRVLGRPASGHP